MNFQSDTNECYRNDFLNKHLLWYAKKYLFFYKQPVFKQLVLGWQIAILESNNKNR